MRAVFFAAVALFVCAATADVTVKGVSFSDDEAAKVLRAVNFETSEALRYQYDIYEWKVRNIVHGRKYRTLVELAQVSGVTSFVLRLLRREVNDACSSVLPPQAGVYDGVTFTDAQAAAALRFVNRHDAYQQLRAIDVWTRNVNNIYAARPVCTIGQLSAVQGVGHTVMRLIHQRVSTAAEGESCSASVPCSGDLVCVGITRMEHDHGTCAVSSVAGTFTPAPATLSVPAAGQSVSAVFTVKGLATVPEDIVLSMDASGVTNKGDLRVVLSVAGQQDFVYYNGVGSFPASRSDVANSRDDFVNGEWTVTVTNTGAAQGSIVDLSLYLTSRFD